MLFVGTVRSGKRSSAQTAGAMMMMTTMTMMMTRTRMRTVRRLAVVVERVEWTSW
jgi:hypothetical protein